MKKHVIAVLLSIFLFSLAGCSDNTASGQNPIPGTGTENTAVSSPETPAESSGSSSAVVPTPTPKGNYVGFSLASGFYEQAQEISLSCNVEGAKIFYTLDGSTPSITSTLYQNPIRVSRKLYEENVLAAQTDISASNTYVPKFSVDKGTVIRAVAYLPDGTVTPIAHATYFIGLDHEAYENLPIISLITDFENLYDYETGIYVLGKTYEEWISEDPARASLDGWQQKGNYSNSGKEWERPVSVELITADGTAGFKQNMGIRIMGGASRNQTQKSLKLYAREDYEAKNLNYTLIPENYSKQGELISKYKTFVLRVGGNDADFARLRDPYLQTLVKDANFETQQSAPCIVFLNGEFWGMYTLNEDYTDNHFENNYGIDNKNVILIKRGEVEEGDEEDLSLFHNMYQFITQNNMANPDMYEVACELVDMSSFVDFFAFQLYIYNQDGVFQDNNWRMWRVRDTDMATEWSDGKWRFAAYDTDYSTGIYDGANAAGYDNLSECIKQSSEAERQSNIKSYRPIELFRSLLKSDEFKNDLILALCDMRNIYFEAIHATEVLNEMAAPYIALMPETYQRFGPDWVVSSGESYTKNKITDLNNFIIKRYSAMPNLIKNAFGLGAIKKLELSVNNTTLGALRVNGRSIDVSSSFSGMYFPENTVTITAIPAKGCKFVRWEVKSGTLTDTTSETISFRMETGLTLQAVFEAE